MFLPIQRVHLTSKQAKDTNFRAQQAKLKASAGHIWPSGRMLFMPDLQNERNSDITLQSTYK